MSTVATNLLTVEQFEQLPLEGVELVRGEVVEMPSPGGVHGKACTNVGFLLEGWSRDDDEFETFGNDSGVVTERDPDSVRGPDVCVVRRSKLEGGRIPTGIFRTAPELCVEVRSPSDRWKDVLGKVAEYLDRGVLEVWAIDTETRRVHVYTPDSEPTVLETTDILASTTLPGFSAPVTELFRGL